MKESDVVNVEKRVDLRQKNRRMPTISKKDVLKVSREGRIGTVGR